MRGIRHPTRRNESVRALLHRLLVRPPRRLHRLRGLLRHHGSRLHGAMTRPEAIPAAAPTRKGHRLPLKEGEGRLRRITNRAVAAAKGHLIADQLEQPIPIIAPILRLRIINRRLEIATASQALLLLNPQHRHKTVVTTAHVVAQRAGMRVTATIPTVTGAIATTIRAIVVERLVRRAIARHPAITLRQARIRLVGPGLRAEHRLPSRGIVPIIAATMVLGAEEMEIGIGMAVIVTVMETATARTMARLHGVALQAGTIRHARSGHRPVQTVFVPATGLLLIGPIPRAIAAPIISGHQ